METRVKVRFRVSGYIRLVFSKSVLICESVFVCERKRREREGMMTKRKRGRKKRIKQVEYGLME